MSYRIRHAENQGAEENLPLLSRSERAWLFAERHRRAMLIGILIASLAAVVLGGLLWFQSDREHDAAALADQAAQAYFDRGRQGRRRRHGTTGHRRRPVPPDS